jgi:SHS2 domain-containing protein
MPYRYLEHVATADVAFEAWGATPEELFVAAADATVNLTVENPAAIGDRERRRIAVDADALDMLLFELLQALVYYKDAESLLLRIPEVRIERRDGGFHLEAEGRGETIDPGRHALYMDIKAVTLHEFRVEQTPEGWEAFVLLDV